MQFFYLKKLLRLAAVVAICVPTVKADEQTTHCWIFTGDTERQANVDLSVYKRVSFNADSFTLTAPEGSEATDIELPYSDFYHISFDQAVPTDFTSAVSPGIDAEFALNFNESDKSIYATGADAAVTPLSVFALDGRRLMSATLSTANPVSVESLRPGVYIATALTGSGAVTIKFIIR